MSTVAANGTIAGICTGTGIYGSLADYAARPTGFNISLNGGLGAVLRACVVVANSTG